MILFLQFPIADARPFTPNGGNRLKKPIWPPPTGVGLPKSFVRAFGQAKPRYYGPDFAWPDEMSFCDASRALRFDTIQSPRRIKCAFRRVLFDGCSVGRIETAIGLSSSNLEDSAVYWGGKSIENHDPLPLLRQLLTLSTRVPFHRRRPNQTTSISPRPLIMQGPYLAQLFAQATTERPGANDERVAYDLVSPGNPLAILECQPDQMRSLPKGFVRIPPEKVNGIDLAYGRIEMFGGYLGIWMASFLNVEYEYHLIRSLRICLGRLHAEQEVLQSILSNLENGSIIHNPGDVTSDALEMYLNRSTKIINQKKWGGIDKSAILLAFQAFESTGLNHHTAYLTTRLQGARRQIRKKVERFQDYMQKRQVTNIYQNIAGGDLIMAERVINIGAGASVNAPVVMADKIENSFNVLAKSPTNDEVKSLMTELLKRIASAGSTLSGEQAEELARDAEALTQEVASNKPRRKWYEFSLKNIKETAQAIGDVGKPILEIIGKLIEILPTSFPG